MKLHKDHYHLQKFYRNQVARRFQKRPYIFVKQGVG